MLRKIRVRFFICKYLAIFLGTFYIISSYAINDIVFIVNPKAGGGECRKIWNSVKKRIEDRVNENNRFKEFTTELCIKKSSLYDDTNGSPPINEDQSDKTFTDSGDLLRHLIKSGEINLSGDNENSMTTIVAVGGDGTFSEIANVLLQNEMQVEPTNANTNYKYTLAILPFGTGNSLAQGLKIPHAHTEAEINKAIDIVVNGETAEAGCFKIIFDTNKTSYSFVEVDLGASCKAGELQKNPPCAFAPFWNCISHQGQYDISTKLASLSPPKTKINLTIKSKKEFELIQLTDLFNCTQINNMELTFAAASVTPFFGGDFEIHPQANALGDIGYISFIDKMNLLDKLKRVKYIKSGAHTHSSHYYSNTISLKENHILNIYPSDNIKIPVQIDGERNNVALPITIEWLPKHYNIKASSILIHPNNY